MALGICWLRVLIDSLLIVNQANKEWSCLDDKMMMYCQELHKLENNFDSLEYLHILREERDCGWVSQAQLQSGYGPPGGLYARTPWVKHHQSIG
jgi:hypothetical protein